MAKLSRDAEITAKCLFSFGQTTISFKRPNMIHPRTSAALDELTSAGMLVRSDDPRGAREWEPTAAMSVARKFEMPTEDEAFPITTKDES